MDNKPVEAITPEVGAILVSIRIIRGDLFKPAAAAKGGIPC